MTEGKRNPRSVSKTRMPHESAARADGYFIPDGNEALRDDIPVVVELIERTARWVNPETFRRLPVWAPHTARGRPLYTADWTRRYTTTRKATGATAEKFEGNITAKDEVLGVLRFWGIELS